jgi:hypothetical protein
MYKLFKQEQHVLFLKCEGELPTGINEETELPIARVKSMKY